HPMKENQKQSGAADRLPLVGPGPITELQLLNTTRCHGGKQLQSGGAKPPPAGRPRRSKSNQKGGPRGGSLRSRPPGSFFNEKMLLPATTVARSSCALD